ncbi:MAG: nuclear transport factor 2 family protein [Phenylobacterium sp.]|uniref:limonene-1,2-epoxide hydrolase family protein n=1 Tax=Phenylobacterium sp. TaxID=1871053 RepID=UPI001A4F74FB|nr:limonene-1,2-epoxide hydrolase family protein [Phenylobacterium sp.]MBL8773919.1 nuclear transport factor 2 family protein [Phenylobacterium sp.]
MTAQSPIDVVTAFMKAMEQKDYDAGVVHVADDCHYENMPMGVAKGPAGVRAVLEPFFAPIVENEFQVLRQATNGPIVFIERLDRHRLPDRWVELPVTGVYEVRDGKIVFWREYFDIATLYRAWPELQAAAG